MKFSIVIPVYNGEKTIKRAIESCLNQSFNNLEVIVIDNGSTDNTHYEVKELEKKDNRIKYIYEKVSGRSNARNIGIRASIGDYIQFLDADDELGIDKLKRAEEIFSKFKKIDIVISNTEYINQITGKRTILSYPKNFKTEMLLYKNYFPINSIVYKNNKNNFFDPSLSYNEDWLFWALEFQDKRFYFDNYIGAKVYIHGENTMANSKKMIEYQIYVLAKLKKYRHKICLKEEVEDLKKILVYSLYNDASQLDKFIKQIFPVKFRISKFLVGSSYISKYLDNRLKKSIEVSDISY